MPGVLAVASSSLDLSRMDLKLAALRGGLQVLWAIRQRHKTLGINCFLVNPKTWQTALNIPNTAGRDQIKRASLFQAKALTKNKNITDNVADAICMGLVMARKMKAEEKIREAEHVLNVGNNKQTKEE